MGDPSATLFVNDDIRPDPHRVPGFMVYIAGSKLVEHFAEKLSRSPSITRLEFCIEICVDVRSRNYTLSNLTPDFLDLLVESLI